MLMGRDWAWTVEAFLNPDTSRWKEYQTSHRKPNKKISHPKNNKTHITVHKVSTKINMFY